MFREKINTQEESKKGKYEKLCNGVPDCISVLGQGVKETPSNNKLPMQSTSYTGVDSDNMMVAGKARVIAANELANFFPNIQIVTNSKGHIKNKNLQKQEVRLAKIMSEELKNLGVKEEKITLQEESYSVFTELIELIKMIVGQKWKHVVVLTNEYQVPRCQAMFERMDSLHDPNGESEKDDFKQALKRFKEMDIKISFVSAEAILSIKSPHYKNLIDKVKQGEAWKKREKIEEAGTEQIINGTYWKNLPENFVRPDDF